MASKKTAPFMLTERLTLATGAGPTASATIDLASYIDVADRQGLMIHSVDFIFQGATAAGSIFGSLPGGSTLNVQVTDLNRGGVVFANDRALVASGSLRIDNGGGSDMDTDLYPDNYGPSGANEGRIVVNDQLYISANTAATTVAETNVTVRVLASVVSLTAKDFMAIAIQSTAADN
jgi:hypothetical protein